MSKHLSVLADLIKNVNLANIGISDLSFGLYKSQFNIHLKFAVQI